MTEVTDTPAKAAGMTLTESQEIAAKALKEADAVASQYRRRVLDLESEARNLRIVLARVEEDLTKVRAERDVSVALLREHFALYRDLMEMGDGEVTP